MEGEKKKQKRIHTMGSGERERRMGWVKELKEIKALTSIGLKVTDAQTKNSIRKNRLDNNLLSLLLIRVSNAAIYFDLVII